MISSFDYSYRTTNQTTDKSNRTPKSRRIVVKSSSKTKQLVLQETNNMGQDYALTLKEWRMRFDANWENIHSLGFDTRFKRMWHYYLAYCEGAFRAGAIDTHQLVFKKV